MKKKILAICGSTRQSSSNLSLIKAIAALTNEIVEISIYDGLDKLPHFNPDDDNEHVSVAVKDFRTRIRLADGVLICAPEYAMGVPGTLKNAIDWTVSSIEFSKKPTALITASSMGEKAHTSLLETLKVIECRITEDTQLLISHIRTKITKEEKITDAETMTRLQHLLKAFSNLL